MLFDFQFSTRGIKKVMLYTGKGDDGTTTLCDTPRGIRVDKYARRIEALGTIDELNSFIGLCKATLHSHCHPGQAQRDPGSKSFVYCNVAEMLHGIQEDLFIVQAEIAGAGKSLTKKHIGKLEGVTGEIEKQLEPIHSFIITGSSKESALLDVARTMARRAERRVVEAVYYKELEVGKHTIPYLNRLSSVLYAAARLVGQKENVTEHAPKYK